MNLAIHILKKDVRRSRFLLALWLVLVGARCVLMCANTRDGAIAPLFALQWLLLVVLIPLLVQSDPLVGTTAFWLTRPISRLTLLKSKMLFVLLVFVLIPLLGDVVVLEVNRVVPHDLLLAVAETAMEQLLFILCIAILAVVTPDFGRFAIAGVGTIVGLFLLAFAIERFGGDSTAGETPSATASRLVACILIGILAAGATVIHQYLTRRTVVTAFGAILCTALILGFQECWLWDYLKPPIVPAGDVNFDARKIKLAPRRPHLVWPANNKLIMVAGFDVQGIPKGYSLSVRVPNSNLKLADGSSLDLNGTKDPLLDGSPDAGAWEDDFEAALAGAVVFNSSNNDGRRDTPQVTMESRVLDKEPAQPGGFAAHVDMVAYRYVVTGEMPPVKGAGYDHGSEHVVITDVRRHLRGVTITVRERRVNLLLEPNDNPAGEYQRVHYILINKKRWEAYVQAENYPSSDWLVNRRMSLSFDSKNETDPDITPAWLADATLERIEWIPVAAFSRQLTADKFSPDKESPGTSSGSLKPNDAALEKIVPPPNATAAQAGDYVDRVIQASRKQAWFGDNDPQVAMIEKVGRANLAVLIDFANRLNGNRAQEYITQAIKGLAGPEDEALVLKGLEKDPALVDLVVKYGWQASARDTLVEGVANSKDLPVAWVAAVASLHDASTYPALKAYLVNGANPRETFEAVNGLPGIDLTDAVDELWKARRTESPYAALQVCGMAAQYGHADAIEPAAEILEKEKDQYDVDRAREIIMRFTPATGDDAALAAWVESNRGKLTFDKHSGKFAAPK